MPSLGSILKMVSAPVQTILLHLIRKFRLNPKCAHGNQSKPDHERPVSHVPDLVHHEGHAAHLTPRSATLGDGGDASLLSAAGPDLFGLGHAVLEVGVDFGDFFFGDHGGIDFVLAMANRNELL